MYIYTYIYIYINFTIFCLSLRQVESSLMQVEFPRQSESGEISRIVEEPNRQTWSWGKYDVINRSRSQDTSLIGVLKGCQVCCNF